MGKEFTIGVFDSGIGGLAIVDLLRKRNCAHSFLYFADKTQMPYGNKTVRQIYQRALYCYDKLKQNGASVVVAGCNTASLCYEKMRSPLAKLTDFVPTLPPLSDAIDFKYNKILVLATPLSISLLRSHDVYLKNEKNIILHPLPLLAYQIEREYLELDRIKTKLEGELVKFKDKVNCVILGCTHYCFLKNFFAQIFPNCAILDGGENVCVTLKKISPHHLSFAQKSIVRFL